MNASRLRTAGASVDTTATPTTPPKPAKVVAVETRFVGAASNPTTPPKAPTPPAIVVTVAGAVEVVVESEVVAEELESVPVSTLESKPTTPPKAPTPPATVELATVVIEGSVLVDEVVSNVMVLVVPDSILTATAPTTPPNPPCPPAIVTTEPAVGALSFDTAATTPPNPVELDTV